MEQTVYLGSGSTSDIVVYVQSIDSSGTHSALSIDTTQTKLVFANGTQSSVVPTVTALSGVGKAKIVFSSVSNSGNLSAGDTCGVIVAGSSGGVTFSPYLIPVFIDSAGGGGGGLTQADVRTAIGMANADMDTRLDLIDQNVDSVLVDTGTDIPASIAALNNFDPASDVVANVTAVGSITNPVTTDSASRTASQADVSSLATAASIAALNDFDPAADTVANVTTTANVTNAVTTDTASRDASKADVSGLSTFDASTDQVVASNMRGTDSANTVAPDNASISAIKAKTDQMVFSVSGQIDANALTGGGGATAAEVYTYFVTGSNADALKADVTSLASQSSVNTVDVVVDAIKAKTDQLTFTTPNSVDATATVSVDESAIADAVLAGIGGNDVTISSPVASDGTTITIVRGDDYSASDARSITWTGDSDDQWPDLTDATLKFTAKNNLDSMTITPTVTQPTGSQAFRMELTKDDTEILSGRYKYDVQATLSSGRVITLVVGEMIVKQSYSDTP